MGHVYEIDDWYRKLLPWQNRIFRANVRNLRYTGIEHIPTDAAVLFAPNHCNALLDALAVLSIDDNAKVFAARADIFHHPQIARILHWLRIVPIRRIRDGIDEVRHNDVTIAEAVETLCSGVPFCIMPEGTHRQKHSLLPLAKGIFRIALQAHAAFGDEKPIYIVPVGLEYGDYSRQWDTLIVRIGDPICVNEYADSHAELTQPELILLLREELTQRMRQLILWVEDDEHYEERWAYLREHPYAPYDQWIRRRAERPFLVATGLLLTMPIALIAALLTWPIWVAEAVVERKVKDPAFRQSVMYVVKLLSILLSIGLCYVPMIAVEEWRYWWRRIKL